MTWNESLVTHPRFFYQRIRNESLEKCQPTTVAEPDPWKWTRGGGIGVLLQRTWSQRKREQREELRSEKHFGKSVSAAWNKNFLKEYSRIYRVDSSHSCSVKREIRFRLEISDFLKFLTWLLRRATIECIFTIVLRSNEKKKKKRKKTNLLNSEMYVFQSGKLTKPRGRQDIFSWRLIFWELEKKPMSKFYDLNFICKK